MSLTAAINAATAEHDLLARMFSERDAAANAIYDLVKVTRKVRTAASAWVALPASTRQLVLDFERGGAEVDGLAERLGFVVELLTEFREHYARDVGNPGKSRSADAADLRPLEGFVDVLMRYWVARTGTPPGHKVESADDLAADAREARSPFAVLAGEAAAGALDVPYTIGNVETVIRRLKA